MTTNKYQKGKIYKLVNNVDDKIYVGSTASTLTKRKCGHKHKAKSEIDRRVYKHLNEIGWENVEIVLVENYPCNSKDELNARERKWIEELKAELNITMPTRTQQDIAKSKRKWQQNNKEKVAEKKRQWEQDNKEKIAARVKQYRQDNKEKIAEWTRQYQQDNKEKVAEKNRKYQQNNKAKIAEQRRQRKIDKKNKMVETNNVQNASTNEPTYPVLKKFKELIDKLDMRDTLRNAYKNRLQKLVEYTEHDVDWMISNCKRTISALDRNGVMELQARKGFVNSVMILFKYTKGLEESKPKAYGRWRECADDIHREAALNEYQFN